MRIDQLPKRGRMAILWGIGAFIAAQLILNIAIERWRPEWSDPEYGYRFRNLKRQMQKEPNRPVLVVIGSSRVGNGLKADCMPPESSKTSSSPIVYNMSMAGGTPLYELLILKRLLATGVRPRWVVFEVLPPALNFESAVLAIPDPVAPNRIRWSDLEVLDRYAPQSYWHRHQKWMQCVLVPWYSNRYCLLSRYAPSWLEFNKTHQVRFWREYLTARGWLPFALATVTQEEYEKRLAVTRENYIAQLRDFRISAEADQLYHEMLHVCRQEGIEVIGLLRMPEGTDFKKLYSAAVSHQIDSYLNTFCQEENTQLIDASNWMPDDSFADSHHLLPAAAERFSLRLWNEAFEPLIGKNETASVKR